MECKEIFEVTCSLGLSSLPRCESDVNWLPHRILFDLPPVNIQTILSNHLAVVPSSFVLFKDWRYCFSSISYIIISNRDQLDVVVSSSLVIIRKRKLVRYNVQEIDCRRRKHCLVRSKHPSSRSVPFLSK